LKEDKLLLVDKVAIIVSRFVITNSDSSISYRRGAFFLFVTFSIVFTYVNFLISV